jgi:hypothetical protein
VGLMDKAKEAAEQARQGMTQAVDQARGGTHTVPPAESPPADAGPDPLGPSAPAVITPQAPPRPSVDDFVSEMKKAARRGKDSLSTLVEKIDPGILADLIIKATAAQEKANIALKGRGSPYRIAEINITATIPPQIGFAVSRMGDMDELDDPSSLELLEEGVVDTDSPTVSLDGDNPIEDIGPS